MDGDLRARALHRVESRRARTPILLYAVGLLLIVLPLLPVEGLLANAGGADGLTRFCLGILFLYVGALIQERQRLGRSFRELLAAFDSFDRSLNGAGAGAQRRAVDILVETLRSAKAEVRAKVHAQLVRISGEDFGPEHEPWARWWAEKRASYGARRGAAGDSERGDRASGDF